MLTESNYEALITEIKEEFPDFRIEKKSESQLMVIIDALLRIITFGQMRMFMDKFITTLGNTIYVSTEWDNGSIPNKMSILRHERVHMRQARKYGRFLFSFLYLAGLPAGLAYFRKKFEQEAYEESLRAYHEYYGKEVFTEDLKDSIVRHFTSSEYFWMWPWKKDVENWYDKIVSKINDN